MADVDQEWEDFKTWLNSGFHVEFSNWFHATFEPVDDEPLTYITLRQIEKEFKQTSAHYASLSKSDKKQVSCSNLISGGLKRDSALKPYLPTKKYVQIGNSKRTNVIQRYKLSPQRPSGKY